MANEFKEYRINPPPEDSQKWEGKTVPSRELLYTGTLWRLTRGNKGGNIHPDSKVMSVNDTL